MRCFIGIKLSNNCKNNVIKIMDNLRKENVKGNYTDILNLHITIHFLGEVSQVQEKEIISILKSINEEKFTLKLENLKLMKDILTISILNNERIDFIYYYLYKELTNIGIKLEKREFKPHLTLIRNVVNPVFTLFSDTTIVESIVLFESTKINNKLCYLERCKIKLN